MTSEQESQEPTATPVRDTHLITLSATISGEDSWQHVWENFSLMAGQIGPTYNCHMSSILLGEDEDPRDLEDVTYDDTTLVRVEQAMIRAGLTRDQAGEVINELLNTGILFRERV